MNARTALLREVISCDMFSPENVCLEQGSAHALDSFMEQDSINVFGFVCLVTPAQLYLVAQNDPQIMSVNGYGCVPIIVRTQFEFHTIFHVMKYSSFELFVPSRLKM